MYKYIFQVWHHFHSLVSVKVMTDVGLDWYTEKGSLYVGWREEIRILILWDIRHEQGTPDMGFEMVWLEV